MTYELPNSRQNICLYRCVVWKIFNQTRGGGEGGLYRLLRQVFLSCGSGVEGGGIARYFPHVWSSKLKRYTSGPSGTCYSHGERSEKLPSTPNCNQVPEQSIHACTTILVAVTALVRYKHHMATPVPAFYARHFMCLWMGGCGWLLQCLYVRVLLPRETGHMKPIFCFWNMAVL